MKSIYKIEFKQDNQAHNLYNYRLNVKSARQYISSVRMPFAHSINALKRLRSNNTLALNMRTTISNLRSDIKKAIEGSTYYAILSRTVHGRTFQTTYPLTPVKAGGFIEPVQEFRLKALRQIKYDIREYRKELKRLESPIFHRKPNGLFKEFQVKALKSHKIPSEMVQYVGIEIECVMPEGVDTSPLLPFAKYVNITTDGSVEHGRNETGSEFRVCMRRDKVREILPGIMQALKDMGGTVNRSCGLHVHMDQRQNDHMQAAAAFQRLVRSLGLLYTVVPPSRRKNTFCKRNRYADFDRARNGDRYKAINATAYGKHRTIEVRLFGGTLEATKIINWIETLYAVMEGETVLRCPKTFDMALRYWKLSKENLAWLKERQAKFSQANATMPVSENETEPNNHVMDEYDEPEDETYCEHCNVHGEHDTSECECDDCLAEAA